MSDPELADVETVNPFDAVRDQIKFEGFTKSQRETILDQLEEVYNAEGGTTGREMIDKGLALPDGFTVHNSNSQVVTEALGQEILSDILANNPGLNPTQAEIDQFLVGQFDNNLSGNFAFSGSGDVYINAFPSIGDEKAGAAEIYNFTGAQRDGQTADAQPNITSVDHNGTVFEVPSLYTLVHESNHAINDEHDIEGNNIVAGEYYSPGLIGSDPVTIPNAYYGANEVTTQQILEDMGYEQFRGSYIGTALNGRNIGEEYGLGEEFDVAVTPIYTQDHVNAGATSADLDMTGHGSVDAVIVSPDGLPSTINTGDGRQIVHAFDQNDIISMGDGNDRGFGGLGDDTFMAGRGLDYYDGGEADITPGAADYKSAGTTNWGIDTVDYTTLDAGKPAGLLTPEYSDDGLDRDGILIRIDGTDALVLKGNAAGVPGEQADQLHNIDLIKGTGRDDLTEVESLSGALFIDGNGGTDTLRIQTMPEGTAVTNVPGAGTFNGQGYEGYITVGAGTLYYNDYENIELPKKELEIPETEAPVKEAVNEGATSHASDIQELPMEEALIILKDESEKALELSPDVNGSVNGMLNTPAGVSVMETLVNNEQSSVPVSTTAMNGNAYDRVEEVLRGSTDRLSEIGKTHEAEALFNELQSEELSAKNVTQDYSADNSQFVVSEDEMSYGL